MKKKLEDRITTLDAEQIMRIVDAYNFCPYFDTCATEYGQSDVCQGEDYGECSIYQQYKKLENRK